MEALLRKKAMRERGEPLKQVLNNAVRDGLRMAQAKPENRFGNARSIWAYHWSI